MFGFGALGFPAPHVMGLTGNLGRLLSSRVYSSFCVASNGPLTFSPCSNNNTSRTEQIIHEILEPSSDFQIEHPAHSLQITFLVVLSFKQNHTPLLNNPKKHKTKRLKKIDNTDPHNPTCSSNARLSHTLLYVFPPKAPLSLRPP